MKKRTVILAGILTILAIITSIGVTARIKQTMIPKPIKRLPEGRVEYRLTDTEMKNLEKELKALEEESPVVEEETEEITIE